MYVGYLIFFMELLVVRNLYCFCVDDKLSLNWEYLWNFDYMGNDGV